MKTRVTRRDFFRTGVVAGLGARLFGGLGRVTFAQSKGSRPLVVSSANGLRATARPDAIISTSASDGIQGRRIDENDSAGGAARPT